jgi:hypothetical protein
MSVSVVIRGGHPIFFSWCAIDGSITFFLLFDYDKSRFLGICRFANSMLSASKKKSIYIYVCKSIGVTFPYWSLRLLGLQDSAGVVPRTPEADIWIPRFQSICASNPRTRNRGRSTLSYLGITIGLVASNLLPNPRTRNQGVIVLRILLYLSLCASFPHLGFRY